MFYTYIIISESSGKLYIGQTRNLTERLHRHNSNRNVSTSKKGPWELIFFREFRTRQDALMFEKKLKSMKNKEYVLRKIESQEL